MKGLITTMVCLASLSSFAQNSKVEFEGTNWIAPYLLATPKGWNVGYALLANEISYAGHEDVRLMPGWNNPHSDEYWTYASLWSLDNAPKMNEEAIKNSLTAYFTDLLNKNIEKQKIPAKKILPVKTWITELKAENDDLKTFYGAIAMLDYKQQHPISLNCIVHVRICPGQPKTIVFYELSPKPLTNAIWNCLLYTSPSPRD